MPRVKALAWSLASLFATAPVLASATVWTVDSCLEGSSGSVVTHTGTLRFAAENAQSNDQVDLTQLNCSLISLTTASIGFGQQSINVVGPGATALQIDAGGLHDFSGDDRVLSHSGGGTLKIQGVTLTGGHVYHANPIYISRGGCLYSNGNLQLTDVVVSSCQSENSNGFGRGGAVYAAGDLTMTRGSVSGGGIGGSAGAYGGGIYAKGKATLSYSTVSGNVAGSDAAAQGGGVFAAGDLSMSYSTISGNAANGTLLSARGGGVATNGNVSIDKSTIAGNQSQGNFGGLLATNDNTYATNTFSVFTSTISGNSAAGSVGGAYTNFGIVLVEHDTIASNTAGSGMLFGSYAAPGLVVGAMSSDTTVYLDSSVLSGNVYGATENDLSVRINAITVAGVDNIVRAALDVAFAASPSGACPLLGPLRDNGGPTPTRALNSGSPAIDHGNPTDADYTDQRGSLKVNGIRDFVRVSGPIGEFNPVADVGAFEVQQDDVVYTAGFDGCP